MDSSRMVANIQAFSEVSSKQAPTVANHLSTAAMAKPATAVLAATNSLMVDIHKADMAARHLLEGTAAVDTNSSMATTAMEDDLVGRALDIDRGA